MWTISWEPFNNSPRNYLKYKRITELGFNNDLIQVLFICCPVLVNKIGSSLSRKIRNVLSNMSLFLKKRYEQRGHLCYMHISLRFTTYKYLIYHHLILRSLFIISRKSYLYDLWPLVKRSPEDFQNNGYVLIIDGCCAFWWL